MILNLWIRKVRVVVARLSGRAIFALVGLHFASSWLGMAILGESKLSDPNAWFYYYMTTAVTVGYGDLSPSTDASRWFAALWVLPGSVALFAALIGKMTQIVVDYWRRTMAGKDDFHNLRGHTLILGWHGEQTERMVDLLRQDALTRERPIVLCAIQDMENPLPEFVHFVRGESFAHTSLLQRAGVQGAQRILVYAHNDEQALATALAVLTQEPQGHLVVHFREEASAKVLRHHHPEVEVTCSLSIEVLVRAAQDPGSSMVTQELLSVLDGPTQFSVASPADIPFGTLHLRAKAELDAIVLGFGDQKGVPHLNPPQNALVPKNALIYYIAHQRIPVQAWQKLQS